MLLRRSLMLSTGISRRPRGCTGKLSNHRTIILEDTKELPVVCSVIEDRLAGKREHPIPEEGQEPEPREYLVGKGKGKYSLADINSKLSASLWFH